MTNLKSKTSVFKTLGQNEMNQVSGGRPLLLHHDCVDTQGESHSVDIYGYNWFERTFGGHSSSDVHHESYDSASNCGG